MSGLLPSLVLLTSTKVNAVESLFLSPKILVRFSHAEFAFSVCRHHYPNNLQSGFAVVFALGRVTVFVLWRVQVDSSGVAVTAVGSCTVGPRFG